MAHFRPVAPDLNGQPGVRVYYRDAERKQRSPVLRGRTEAEAMKRARAFAAAVETDIRRGIYRPPERGQQRLNDYWRAYLAKVEAGEIRLAPHTRETWAGVWRLYVDGRFGRRRLAEIRRAHVRDLLEGIASGGQRGHVLAVVRMLLNRAVDEEEIPANPGAHWKLGEPESAREIEPLTPEELDALAGAIRPPYRALIYVAAYGLLRLEEAFALRLNDVDWLRRRVRIDEVLTEVRGRLHFGIPKTRKSRRLQDLPEWVVQELAEHVRRFPPAGKDGLLFTDPAGGPVRRTAWRERVFRPALEAAGLGAGRIAPMHLRHTGASMVHELGYGERDIAEMLGHRSTRMAARYVKLYEGRKRRIADDLGAKTRRAHG